MDIDLAWQESSAELTWDGSWRDIYVLGTTLADWERLLEHLRHPSYGANVDGHFLSTVSELKTYFLSEGSEHHLLSFSVGRVTLNCHFFTTMEIEFDFDPRDRSGADITELARFMAEIGALLDKTVVLTPENRSEHPIYRYDAKTRTVRYVRP